MLAWVSTTGYEDHRLDSFLLEGLESFLPGALPLNPELGDHTATSSTST